MSQHSHDIFESRKQFQLERIILFSDAVFAIAITLLILEIKLPESEGQVTQQMLMSKLTHLIPDFIGFFISFVVIGQFWTNHHRLFGYVSGYDGKLLWLNLFMMCMVALMPFTTHLNMQYGNLDVVWFIYSLNLPGIGFGLLLMWRHIAKHAELSYMSGDKNFMKMARVRSIAVVIIFIIGGCITFLPFFWIKWSSRFFFFFLFPVLGFIRRKYTQKTLVRNN